MVIHHVLIVQIFLCMTTACGATVTNNQLWGSLHWVSLLIGLGVSPLAAFPLCDFLVFLSNSIESRRINLAVAFAWRSCLRLGTSAEFCSTAVLFMSDLFLERFRNRFPESDSHQEVCWKNQRYSSAPCGASTADPVLLEVFASVDLITWTVYCNV